MRRPRRAERRAEMKKLETARSEHYWEFLLALLFISVTSRREHVSWTGNRTNPLRQARDVRSHSGSV